MPDFMRKRVPKKYEDCIICRQRNMKVSGCVEAGGGAGERSVYLPLEMENFSLRLKILLSL